MSIGWAIIGTGQFPDRSMAPSIVAAEDTELVAVYSRDQSRADAFAAKHGARAAYSSTEALLEDSRVDVAYIASPNHLHAPYVKLAAQAAKHILVEKPMAVTLGDAVEMVQACRSHGVNLGVNFHVRQHPGHIEARRLILEGVLGNISMAQAQWGAGTRGVDDPPPRSGLSEWWAQPEMIGGASSMMGTGVHCVDDLRFLLGQEVTEVAAITDGQAHTRPLENMAAISLRFDQGTIGIICCGRRMPDSKNNATIYGSDGRIVLDDTLRGPLQGGLEVVSERVNTTAAYDHDPLGLYRSQVEAFNRSIHHGEEPSANGFDGLKAVQVTVAMIESARFGRTVKLGPVPV